MIGKRCKNLGFSALALLVIVIAVSVYLNRAYSHIYDTISMANLRSVDKEKNYDLGSPEASEKLVYVALGDSLTSGVGTETYDQSYPYLLATKLAGDNKGVILKNHSVPGVRTNDLLNGLLPAALKESPDIVTLLVGVNDVHNKLSVPEFEKQYVQILGRLSQETSAQIYVINIPYIGADSLVLPPYDYIFDARTKEFNKIIKNLAEKFELRYIDLYTPTVSLFKQDGSHYSRDLFHPSSAGYKIWADLIYDSINK